MKIGTRGKNGLTRSRWAAFGAAVAVSLGAGGAGWIAHAAPGPVTSVFVSMTPCRLFDTRPQYQVSDRSTPLLTAETWVRQVWGTNGNCTIPSTATAVAYNLTVPDPVVDGFITVYPADASLPQASSINPVANGGTKANSGVVGLSATGAIDLYNHTGPIQVLMDITGYYAPGGAGGTGPAGPQGPAAWDNIPSGQTVTGEIVYDSHQSSNAGATLNVSDGVLVSLPGVAPVALNDATVVFGKGPLPLTFPNLNPAEVDNACAGSFASPSAPAGKVCVYFDDMGGIDETTMTGSTLNLPTRGFLINWHPLAADNSDEFLYATWAYTAP